MTENSKVLNQQTVFQALLKFGAQVVLCSLLLFVLYLFIVYAVFEDIFECVVPVEAHQELGRIGLSSRPQELCTLGRPLWILQVSSSFSWIAAAIFGLLLKALTFVRGRAPLLKLLGSTVAVIVVSIALVTKGVSTQALRVLQAIDIGSQGSYGKAVDAVRFEIRPLPEIVKRFSN